MDTIDECGVNSDGGGVQQEYIEAVQKRIRDEVSKNNRSTDLWLVDSESTCTVDCEEAWIENVLLGILP